MVVSSLNCSALEAHSIRVALRCLSNVGLTDDGSCGLSAKVCIQGYAAVVKHDTASALAMEQINVHFGGEIGGIKAFNHLHRGASVLG